MVSEEILKNRLVSWVAPDVLEDSWLDKPVSSWGVG